ncbi:MAG: Smr/MutS family protein [Nannocystaceae bacterium]|nr:Smr/MutS family protein [Nannocystaceae bacterium]
MAASPRPAANHERGDEIGLAVAAQSLPLHGDLQQCQARHDEVDELESVIQRSAALDGGARAGAGALGRVVPLQALLQRASGGLALDPAELLAVADVLAAAIAWADGIESAGGREGEVQYPTLLVRLASLQPPRTLAQTLARAIERDGDAGVPALADAASATLASLRERVRRAKAELRTAAERLLRKPSLADAFGDAFVTERDGRVVLPVRTSAFSRSGTPGTISGIIHDASQSGQTLFVEPHELVDENNALRHAMVAVRAEEQRVLEALSRQVAERRDAIAGSLAALIAIDGIAARLELSRALAGITPRLCEPLPDAALTLPQARHPLMLLRGREVVPNDLRVGTGTALVVSGPNAGGKTVALKTMGLCVLLARAGVRLPTGAPATVPLFRNIVTDVGDDQSIARDLSTFSAHIGHVRRACEAAATDGAGTLVLLDEVAVGTDPDQGAALAEAIVRRLVDDGATAVVTTHYERLKLLAHGDARFVNAAVGFDLASLSSTFRVHVGIPGNSSALAVARRLGLSPRVLDAAHALIDDGRAQLDVVLVELAALREQLAAQTEALQAERAATIAARQRLEALEADETARASAKLLRANEAAAAELRGLAAQLRDARRALRRADAAALDGAGEALRAGRQRLEQLRAQLPAPPPAPVATPPQLAVGDRVRVTLHHGALVAEGEVVALKGERVSVQLPSGRVTVERTAISAAAPARASRPAAARPGPAPVSEAGRHFGADARPVDPGIDNVVDLRGARADEALALLESQLSRALEADIEVVVVRHGHGTGALRKAVREHLPSLAHVARQRPGLPEEGGDAVTVVWVRG